MRNTEIVIKEGGFDMSNDNILMIAMFLIGIVAIYGFITTIILYKKARTTRDAKDAAIGNIKVTFVIIGIIFIITIALVGINSL
jgi:heme/copper-type cytochrome/quinol oxidase subunit 2